MSDTTNPALQTVKPQAGEEDALSKVQAILYQCDRGNASLQWIISALRGIVDYAAPAQAAIDAREHEAHRDYRADFDTRARRLLEKARGTNPLDGQAVMARDLERLCEFYLASRDAAPAPAAAKEVEIANGVEKYLADMIDRAPDPLRRLGEWLSSHLDEDEWPTAERLIFGAQEAALAQPAPVQPRMDLDEAFSVARSALCRSITIPGTRAVLDVLDVLDVLRERVNIAMAAKAAPVQQEAAGDAMKQWAWHWFGPDADEQWISQALANLPSVALTPPAMAAPAQQPEGLPMTQERKYTVTGSHIVNRASGEVIPHDEPVFIFRARDKFAVHALLVYAEWCTGAHYAAVRKRAKDFRAFASRHPERMKAPDTTVVAAPAQAGETK